PRLSRSRAGACLPPRHRPGRVSGGDRRGGAHRVPGARANRRHPPRARAGTRTRPRARPRRRADPRRAQRPRRQGSRRSARTLVSTWDPARTAEYFDELGESEWTRFERGITPAPSIAIHTQILEGYVRPG